MFRCAVSCGFSALRSIRSLSLPYINAARIANIHSKEYSTLNRGLCNVTPNTGLQHPLVTNRKILKICTNLASSPVRTVTKFSINKGKRKSVKAVTRRFFRLHWGMWIRPMVGRHKKMWKKSANNKRRLRQHVFTNSQQSQMLDKMVTMYWKRPKHYVDDPYQPFHTRDEFPITRRKPNDPKY